MIVFESVEEFEKAVMEIVTRRLCVNISLETERHYLGSSVGNIYTVCGVESVHLFDKEV